MKYIFFFSALLLLSCHSKQESKSDAGNVYETTAQSTSTLPDANGAPVGEYMIKTGHYRYQVDNVDESTREIEGIVISFGGFIANMHQVSNSNGISNNIIIRAPAGNFSTLMDDLGKQAVFVDYKRISTEDVTEEFIDIESRLKTKREVLERYTHILKEKAKTVEDVLKAEDKIRVIQEEIEQKEGRLKYLRNKISLSSIHLEIYQTVNFAEVPETFRKPYLAEAREAFTNGWSIVTSLVLFLIRIWPVTVITLAVIIWKRNWIRGKPNNADTAREVSKT